MIFIGIDPGQSGGIAVLGNVEDPGVSLHRLNNTEADIAEFLRRQTDAQPCIALIERVHSMPKQGVASSFKFGQNYGLLRGCLIALRIPFEEVSPQVWQKAMGCLSRGQKNVTKAKAQQLFPWLTVTHAIADALLIAEHARRTHGNGK